MLMAFLFIFLSAQKREENCGQFENKDNGREKRSETVGDKKTIMARLMFVT